MGSGEISDISSIPVLVVVLAVDFLPVLLRLVERTVVESTISTPLVKAVSAPGSVLTVPVPIAVPVLLLPIPLQLGIDSAGELGGVAITTTSAAFEVSPASAKLVVVGGGSKLLQ
jgi:hypothetical protein